jgi:hypothetical protein
VTVSDAGLKLEFKELSCGIEEKSKGKLNKILIAKSFPL